MREKRARFITVAFWSARVRLEVELHGHYHSGGGGTNLHRHLGGMLWIDSFLRVATEVEGRWEGWGEEGGTGGRINLGAHRVVWKISKSGGHREPSIDLPSTSVFTIVIFLVQI